MAEFVLSKRAQRDVVNAILVSLKDFGPMRADAYLARLEACCSTLGERPNPGTPSPGFKPPLYWVLCGSHVIYYRVTRKRVLVVRVLHRNQQPLRR